MARLAFKLLIALLVLGATGRAASSASSRSLEYVEKHLLTSLEYSQGGTIHYRGNVLLVPDSYLVLSFSGTPDRLLLTACFYSEERGEYLTELWMYGLDRSQAELVFDARKVLFSDELHGKRENLCYSTVSCSQATALYLQHWESGSTRVFKASGDEVKIEWPTTKPSDDGFCQVDFIRPIGWYTDPSDNNVLACLACGEGDSDPYILLYALESGELSMGPLGRLLGEIGGDLFIGFSNGDW